MARTIVHTRTDKTARQTLQAWEYDTAKRDARNADKAFRTDRKGRRDLAMSDAFRAH